ncbi:hypothetical protein F5148DRAFT_1370669 [Russula earlei]|uniref:Uncharacterized protein n=1 Tax=Russula earlei TaxID=71964 RepID=A0ACC0TVT5_9AGAM|nr:hypothetical protein F5148DRAFT_1370669 [Russula earlei]
MNFLWVRFDVSIYGLTAQFPGSCTLPFPPPDHRLPYGADPGLLVVLVVPMDTPQPPSIITQPLKRKERSPSPALKTPGHTSTTGSRPSPTFFTFNSSFSPSSSRTSCSPGSAFPAGPSAGIPRLDFLPPPAQPSAERTHSGTVADSDGDGDSEQAARPKQKRRRQALSLHECKRRKIKCDRAHPCTPCIRRGDQGKCQWHVIEPVDKYVSRTEYDELKARVDRLETFFSRSQLQPGSALQPSSESSSSQTQQQATSTRLPSVAVAVAVAGPSQQSTSTASLPMMSYNPISPPGPNPPQGSPFPAVLTGPSRPESTGPKDYNALVLRPPNSPGGRPALPSLASLAHGPTPFGGPPPPSRLHREREHREQQHQPYASLPQPPLQQPLQQPPADKKLPRADAHPAGRAPAPPHPSPRPSGHLSPSSPPQQQRHPPTPPIDTRSPGPSLSQSARLPRSPPRHRTAQRSAIREEREPR